MSNSVYFDPTNYFNIQGIASLKAQSKSDTKVAQHEVAQQFESMLVQMLLKSMRDANKALIHSSEEDSSQALYQDLFDKQVALSIAHQGLGFGKAVERYLGQQSGAIAPMDQPIAVAVNEAAKAANQATNQAAGSTGFLSDLDFIKNLWGDAKKAGSALGLDPKLLLAQAALETGWGKSIIAHASEGSSHNVFNIKADPSWDKKSLTINALEEKEGMMVKERSAFRAYESYADSFTDYIHFIKSNPRYSDALKNAANPESYIRGLQEANYATDSNYSNKVLEIYHGDRFNQLVEQAQLV